MTHQPFFKKYGETITITGAVKSAYAFKDHSQFQLITDIIARKQSHHAILMHDFSSRLHFHFMYAYTLHLNATVEVIHLDCNLVNLDDIVMPIHLSDDKTIYLIALSNPSPTFMKAIEPYFHHSSLRFLCWLTADEYHSYTYLEKYFSIISLSGLTPIDAFTILKSIVKELEQYHQVTISEELLTFAYSLAERYLNIANILEETTLLLDSSAARAIANNQQQASKPIVTQQIICDVLATKTNIPTANLSANHFKLADFSMALRQRLYGQEMAISLYANALQQSHAHLQTRLGPFCAFLLTGPLHVGKKTSALYLVEQLFKQSKILHFAQALTPTITSLAEMKLQRCEDKYYSSFKQVVTSMPYAVIFINHIEHASPQLLEDLHQLLATGHIHDDAGNDYNCRQTIIILSTTLGGERLADLTKLLATIDEDQPVDLMHLVLNEPTDTSKPEILHYSPQELIDEIRPDFTSVLPESILQHLHIVPFLPLSKTAVEAILHHKLRILCKELQLKYQIDLNYAPEVLHYLANETTRKQTAHTHVVNIEKVLKNLYFTIEHAIFSRTNHHQLSNQLILQLNETGQLLRCDWNMLSSMRQHIN